ncbi:MAG: EutN/CcmL family microcompartment protein [Opitutales bacterium]|jgi:ethanolamine utilization protein EutN|nr:EutN/CcmL family microcompartment protein [Opitutales bacterium]MDP4643223.1 EutN/CcmL family microcompartment protein [Opitutales bacterium]MDP4694380.1 EutN/CcmL family microcompartment protein [Opitutales bacterium]MDP4778266.1 EutN/CcmL family microcompartment protein [Opitutales bacterium]MDP4882503.1 EutN/CcmL family microcompartment protein [Opitutales bacterium]
MYLATVIGSVVSTKKDETMKGRKLLMVRPMLVDPADPSKFKPGNNTIVAIDTLGAGEGELVMLAQGSSARQAEGLKALPVDAAIIGLVDTVSILGKKTYEAKNS